MEFSSFLSTQANIDNFSAGTEAVSFTNKNAKKFVLLYQDIQQSLKAIWENGEQINSDFHGDWTYEESK